jgi:hypothetical protein
VQFRRLPIDELYHRYLTLDTDENDQIGADGVAALVSGMFGAYANELSNQVVAFLDTKQTGRVDPGKVVCALNMLTSGKAGRQGARLLLGV